MNLVTQLQLLPLAQPGAASPGLRAAFPGRPPPDGRPLLVLRWSSQTEPRLRPSALPLLPVQMAGPWPWARTGTASPHTGRAERVLLKILNHRNQRVLAALGLE